MRLFLFFSLLTITLWAADFTNIGARELQSLVNEGHPVIDIRTQPEWQETGIVQGSHPVTFFDTQGNYNPQLFMLQISQYVTDKNQPFALICRTGSRSKLVADWLGKMGYTKVYNVQWGILDWKKKGYPTVPYRP